MSAPLQLLTIERLCRYSEFLAEQGVPRESVEEIQMPLFLQTENNTGACWLVINQVGGVGLGWCVVFARH